MARPSLGLNRPPPNIIVTTIVQTTVSQDHIKNDIDGYMYGTRYVTFGVKSLPHISREISIQ